MFNDVMLLDPGNLEQDSYNYPMNAAPHSIYCNSNYNSKPSCISKANDKCSNISSIIAHNMKYALFIFATIELRVQKIKFAQSIFI